MWCWRALTSPLPAFTWMAISCFIFTVNVMAACHSNRASVRSFCSAVRTHPRSLHTTRLHTFFSAPTQLGVVTAKSSCAERIHIVTVCANSYSMSRSLLYSHTLGDNKRDSMVRSDACGRHGHVGLHMDATENGALVDSDRTWCGQCAKLGRMLPSSSKTRRHSHIVNESIWSQISLPTKGVRRNAIIFIMGAAAMYMVC